MDDTKRLLELVNRLEESGPNGDPQEGYYPWITREIATDLRKALQKLEMLEQGARQILLNSI